MSLQNLGLVFFPLIIASIFTYSGSYDITLLFFVFILICALVLAFIIHFEDQKHKRSLNLILNPESNHKDNNQSSIIYKQSSMCKSDEETRLLKIKSLI